YYCFFIDCFFFFSSRRRHTRSKRDWSSDVCSSDLAKADPVEFRLRHLHVARARIVEMAQPELDRIGLRRHCQLVHETLDREHVRSEERRVGKECKCRMGRAQEKEEDC